MELLIEELREKYQVLDNAIQNSDRVNFEECYYMLDSLCEAILLNSENYKSDIPDDMRFVRGLMSTNEAKKYLNKKRRACGLLL